MRGNPILNSLRTAESAGYPALLIISAVCLGLVVGPVALLGLTDAGWVLGLALLYLIVAIVALSVAVGAALSEGDEPDAEGPARTSASIGGLRARSQPSPSLAARRRPSALPAPVAQAPAGVAARRSTPEGPHRVSAVDGAPADKPAEGADARERGVPTSLTGTEPRLDARRVRRAMRRTLARRSRQRN
jgi:hypothetical protein